MTDRKGLVAKLLLLALLTGFILTVQYLLYPMCPSGCSWMLLSPSYMPSLPSIWLSNWFYANPSGILKPTLTAFIMTYGIIAYFLPWERLRRVMASFVFGLAFILPFFTAILFEYMEYSMQMSGISGITSAMIGAATVYAVTWHHLSEESDTELSLFTPLTLFGIFIALFGLQYQALWITGIGVLEAAISAFYAIDQSFFDLRPMLLDRWAATVLLLLFLFMLTSNLFPENISQGGNTTNIIAHYIWYMAGFAIASADSFRDELLSAKSTG